METRQEIRQKLEHLLDIIFRDADDSDEEVKNKILLSLYKTQNTYDTLIDAIMIGCENGYSVDLQLKLCAKAILEMKN